MMPSPHAQQSITDICGEKNQVPEDEKEDEEDNITPTHSEAAKCLNQARKFEDNVLLMYLNTH
jgi:hypothetical protein